MLRDIKSMNQNIFLTVDTTCPLPRTERPPTPKSPIRPTFEPPPTIPEDEIHMENENSPKKHRRKHHRKRHRKHARNFEESDIPEWIKAEMEVASVSTSEPNHRVRIQIVSIEFCPLRAKFWITLSHNYQKRANFAEQAPW